MAIKSVTQTSLFTSVIAANTPAAKYLAIFDENGDPILNIKSFDIENNQAELYKLNETGQMTEEVEIVHLPKARVMFKIV